MNHPIADHLKRLSRRDWNVYRETIAHFEAAWSGPAGDPRIDDFLASPERQPLRSLLLIHLIKEECERKRAQGEILTMAGYFDRFPELIADSFATEELRSWDDKLTGSIENDDEALPPASLPPGYRLIRELPRGGMSRLFLVANATGGLEVLKQIDPARRGNDDDVKRFENEISLARELAAKGIGVVAVFFAGQVDGQLLYTMPYCAGGSLRDRIRAHEGKPLFARDAARLIAALARTVQKFQEEQPAIVHRDLKPENVLFPTETSGWEEPLVADLGLAKVLGADGLTRSGAALGTWVYMAPEQVREPARVDGRADVYTLGVILYECLTGRRPFGGATGPEIIHRIYNETPIDPSKLVASVPAPLDQVVRAMLAERARPSLRDGARIGG